jgi:hypothetical protein
VDALLPGATAAALGLTPSPSIWRFCFKYDEDSGLAVTVMDGVATVACCFPDARKGAEAGDICIAYEGLKNGRAKCGIASGLYDSQFPGGRVRYIFVVRHIIPWSEYARMDRREVQCVAFDAGTRGRGGGGGWVG